MKLKKMFCLMFVCCILFLTGCGNQNNKWSKNFLLSNLKIEDGYIVGKIKNKNKLAYDITIKFKVKSGTFVETETCYEMLKPNETKNLKCLAYDYDDSYQVDIDNIEYKEITIPKLATGKIDKQTLEYHFQEIYDLHTLSYASFSLEFEESKYPYMDEITYNDDEIEIKTELKKEYPYTVTIYQTYSTETNELKNIYGFIIDANDEEFLNKMITKISLMTSLDIGYSYNSVNVAKALLNTDIEKDKCWVVDKWCISPEKGEILYSFYISESD